VPEDEITFEYNYSQDVNKDKQDIEILPPIKFLDDHVGNRPDIVHTAAS